MELQNATHKVGPRLIDRHTNNCVACNERREKMKEMYQIPMEPPEKHVDEIIARDMLLDQMYEDCCKCFISKIEKNE